MLLSDDEISFQYFTRDSFFFFKNTEGIFGFVFIFCRLGITLWSDYTDLKKECISYQGGKQWKTTPKNLPRMQCARAIPVT